VFAFSEILQLDIVGHAYNSLETDYLQRLIGILEACFVALSRVIVIIACKVMHVKVIHSGEESQNRVKTRIFDSKHDTV